jgi:hypothetical protein
MKASPPDVVAYLQVDVLMAVEQARFLGLSDAAIRMAIEQALADMPAEA